MSYGSPHPSRSDLTKHLLFVCHVGSELFSGQKNLFILYFILAKQAKVGNECILQAVSLEKTRVVSGLCSCTNALIKIIIFL